jgi:transposase
MYEYRQILVRMRLGESDRELAKAGLIGRRKAGKLRDIAQSHGWLDTSSPLPDDAQLASVLAAPRAPSAVVSSIAPFAEQVTAWHHQGIAGTTIYRALARNHGYAGSYSAVRRFLQGLAESDPIVTTVLDFAPAEAAQLDFGAGPELVDLDTGALRSSWVFVMTLCFSRHQYAEIVWRQDVATWLACHRRAFEWFGGVVGRVIIDNPKCAITRACTREPEVQRAYAECAEGYGFKIDALPPREPKKKGRVEAGVKYVKSSFLPLRAFRHIDDANRQLREWIMGEAGNRIHGSTRKPPLTLFAEVEQPLLQALPDVAPRLATWSRLKVHGNAHVQFEKCLYSVPFRLVRQTLWLKATDSTIELYREHELVAVHPRLYVPGRRSTVDDHLPPEALAYKLADPQWCLKQAAEIGPHCHALIERLFAHRVLDNLRAAQGVVRMAKRYGATRLETACQRALAFDSARYRTVKHILEKGLDQAAQPDALALAPVYTGEARFLRDTSKLLH